MGKRVFEVAKELGVDHREVLQKCDELRIAGVRNYMSQLGGDDEAKLRQALASARGSNPVEEKVQAPGVVRRRRRARADEDDGPSRSPVRRAVPVRRNAEADSEPAEEPVVRARVLSRPDTPPKAPAPVVEAPKPVAVQAPAAPPPAPAAPAAEPKPAPAAAAPAAEAAPAAAAPEGAEGDAPATRTTADLSEDGPVRRAPAGVPASRSGEEGPTRRPASARTAKEPTQVRTPQPRPGAAGAAKVLGRIPLDQLRSRTARPARRSGPGRPQRSGGPPGRGPGGPPRGPGGPPAARPGMGPNLPPPPDKAGSTRRRSARPASQSSRPGGGGRNQRSRRTVFNREDLYKGNTRARGRKRKISSRRGAKTQLTTPAAHKRVVRIDDTISVGELGKAMGAKTNDLIRKLMQMGVMVTANDQIDLDTAILLATDYDHEVENVAFKEDAVLSGPVDVEVLEADPDAVPRAPVVTIMGHVDHGKTTLLDRIRQANVASGEAGGITQHVGAYRVDVGDNAVVFLDTPGHAAFTAMRARGASVTDVVVLVVAVDDGVMPQTVESINHAKAAGVPILVAVNKMDRPGADPERIKQELTKFELVPEEWGGETMFAPISALNGDGVDALLEALALQSEVLELKANPKNPAFGAVVESRIERGRGTVATVLVQEGTLKKGDYIVAGNFYGRVRAMTDHHGKVLKAAPPSTPVEVLGLNGVPSAGDAFHVVKNEKDAKRVIASRSDKARVQREAAQNKPQDPMELLNAMGKAEKEVQNLILKTDVSGSLEALKASLLEIGNDEVEVRILHSGVGNISDSDITLATASDAVVIGFNVSPDGKAKRSADQAGISIRKFSIIYEVIDAVKEMLSGLLSPEILEEKLGSAEVRAVFHIQRVGTVAGSYVQDGKVVRNAQGRVMRGGKKVHEGKITTLKRFKDDVREVTNGFECGIAVDGYKGAEVGDIIEVFELKEVRRSID